MEKLLSVLMVLGISLSSQAVEVPQDVLDLLPEGYSSTHWKGLTDQDEVCRVGLRVDPTTSELFVKAVSGSKKVYLRQNENMYLQLVRRNEAIFNMVTGNGLFEGAQKNILSFWKSESGEPSYFSIAEFEYTPAKKGFLVQSRINCQVN